MNYYPLSQILLAKNKILAGIILRDKKEKKRWTIL